MNPKLYKVQTEGWGGDLQGIMEIGYRSDAWKWSINMYHTSKGNKLYRRYEWAGSLVVL